MRKTCQPTRHESAMETARQRVKAKTTEDRGLSCTVKTNRWLTSDPNVLKARSKCGQRFTLLGGKKRLVIT